MHVLVIADLHLDTWQHAALDPFSPAFPALNTVNALIRAADLANNSIRNCPKALNRLMSLTSYCKDCWTLGRRTFGDAETKHYTSYSIPHGLALKEP